MEDKTSFQNPKVLATVFAEIIADAMCDELLDRHGEAADLQELTEWLINGEFDTINPPSLRQLVEDWREACGDRRAEEEYQKLREEDYEHKIEEA